MTYDTDPNSQMTAVTLRERRPGQSVVIALVSDPGLHRPRGRFARIVGRSPPTRSDQDWYRGACAEIAVGQMLTGLAASTCLYRLPNRQTTGGHARCLCVELRMLLLIWQRLFSERLPFPEESRQLSKGRAPRPFPQIDITSDEELPVLLFALWILASRPRRARIDLKISPHRSPKQ